jgi:hypothetical protein
VRPWEEQTLLSLVPVVPFEPDKASRPAKAAAIKKVCIEHAYHVSISNHYEQRIAG